MAQRSLLLNAAIVAREEVLGTYQRSALYWPRWLALRAVNCSAAPVPSPLASLTWRSS